MDEKKLTDEEIVKALLICGKDGNCRDCPYMINEIDCCNRCERDYLDLIQRLQDELSRQKNFVAAWEKSWKIANEENTKLRVKLKKKIADLTEERENMQAEIMRLEEERTRLYSENVELKKGVKTYNYTATFNAIEVDRWLDGYKQGFKEGVQALQIQAKESAFVEFMGEPIIRASKINEICEELVNG